MRNLSVGLLHPGNGFIISCPKGVTPFMSKAFRILFVCTGNICRTPMAVCCGQAQQDHSANADNIHIDSAGTWAIEGAPAAPLSISVCEENGMDASAHLAKPVDLTLMKNSDLVLCMSLEHKTDLLSIFPHLDDRIFTLREYGAAETPELISIPDPYGHGIEHYRETFQLIQTEMHRLWPHVENAAQLLPK